MEIRFRAGKGYRGFANWAYQQQRQDGTSRDSVGNLMEFTDAPANKFNLGAYWGPFDGF